MRRAVRAAASPLARVGVADGTGRRAAMGTPVLAVTAFASALLRRRIYLSDV